MSLVSDLLDNTPHPPLEPIWVTAIKWLFAVPMIVLFVVGFIIGQLWVSTTIGFDFGEAFPRKPEYVEDEK